MPRTMVPAGDKSLNNEPGGPELTPAQIEAKVKQDPAAWNQHADGLRIAALESLKIIKAKDAEGLFTAGDTGNAAIPIATTGSEQRHCRLS